jgi:hypothetical protein
MRAHPYVALVEVKQGAADLPTKVCDSTADNSLSGRLQCSGTKVAVSARFVDVAVEQVGPHRLNVRSRFAVERDTWPVVLLTEVVISRTQAGGAL